MTLAFSSHYDRTQSTFRYFRIGGLRHLQGTRNYGSFLSLLLYKNGRRSVAMKLTFCCISERASICPIPTSTSFKLVCKKHRELQLQLPRLCVVATLRLKISSYHQLVRIQEEIGVDFFILGFEYWICDAWIGLLLFRGRVAKYEYKYQWTTVLVQCHLI